MQIRNLDRFHYIKMCSYIFTWCIAFMTEKLLCYVIYIIYYFKLYDFLLLHIHFIIYYLSFLLLLHCHILPYVLHIPHIISHYHTVDTIFIIRKNYPDYSCCVSPEKNNLNFFTIVLKKAKSDFFLVFWVSFKGFF